MIQRAGFRAWFASRKGPGGALRTSGFPIKGALLMWSVLLLLALGTSWLLQRGNSIDEATRVTARGRALAELVAQAVGSDVTFQDTPRFLRILECAARDGRLLAGAVLDRSGAVVAHTDVSRTGMQVELPAPALEDDVATATAFRNLAPLLFGKANGRLLVQPLVGAEGPVGTVVLLLPATESHGLFGRDALRFFLPAGLLLLAFVGFMQATVRWAFKPTSEFLERLTCALERNQSQDGASAPQTAQAETVMQRTVSSIQALSQAKQSLTLENRVLEYAKRRMALILDQLPDGLVMTDSLEKVVFVNRSAGTLLQIPREESATDTYTQVPETALAVLQSARKTGQALLPMQEGQRQILVNRIPLAGSGGRSTGTLFVLRDVTAQHAAQQAQAEFLAQITHELKAPLNTIVAYVEALSDEDLLNPTERREFFNTLNDEAMRMAQLISNLLQLSRIQLGNLSAQFGFVKSEALVRERTEALRSQVEARSQTLVIDLPENLPALYGDKDLLGVALTNLVTNAIKYTPAGGRITVRAEADEKGITVEVADTGIGIPEEARARIFERFARSEQEEVRRETGSGLGLALVKEIVELHEGHVTVESQLGKGSCFRIWLPAREVGSRLDLAA